MSEFNVGDEVWIVSEPFYYGDDGPTASWHGEAGDLARVVYGRNEHGDYYVRLGEGEFAFISEDCLELVEDRPFTAPSAGSVTLSVDVKFFLGDRDVTDLMRKFVDEGAA